jgi:uncharacterized protein (UPF0335 family)
MIQISRANPHKMPQNPTDAVISRIRNILEREIKPNWTELIDILQTAKQEGVDVYPIAELCVRDLQRFVDRLDKLTRE